LGRVRRPGRRGLPGGTETKEHDTNAEEKDQVIPQMRVMDNGTGFGLNYSPKKNNKSPYTTDWRRKTQLHVSGSQLVKHFMGLLCNKLLGVEN
jgi:hypothetical protein